MDLARLAIQLKQYRKTHRLTQAGLAEATGGEVSRSRIADFEQETGSPPTVKAIRALARLMGISYRELCGVESREIWCCTKGGRRSLPLPVVA